MVERLQLPQKTREDVYTPLLQSSYWPNHVVLLLYGRTGFSFNFENMRVHCASFTIFSFYFDHYVGSSQNKKLQLSQQTGENVYHLLCCVHLINRCGEYEYKMKRCNPLHIFTLITVSISKSNSFGGYSSSDSGEKADHFSYYV